MNRKSIFALVALGVIVVSGILLWEEKQQPSSSRLTMGIPIVAVSLPSTITAKAQQGKVIFEANCASCHGKNAVGQEGVAPPLVHKIYEPSHHGDESFQRAVAIGVRAHHWPFGNMPPVEGLDRGDVSRIIAYIRELQRENGIF